MITVSVLIVSGIHIELWKIRFPDYQHDTLTCLVFGPESVSYERSRRETAAKFHHCSARVFFVKTSKSQDSMIYTILSFFRIHIPENGFFPHAFQSPDPAARPPVMDHRLSNWFVFQYFSVHRFSNWFVFQYFSVHMLSNWLVSQYFSVHRL